MISQEEIRKHINNVIPSQLSPQILVGERRKGKKEGNKEESIGKLKKVKSNPGCR